MDEATLIDLKQFIEQQVGGLRQDVADIRESMVTKDELATSLAALETRLSHKIEDLSDSVADAMEQMNLAAQQQLNDHERRITTLETQRA